MGRTHISFLINPTSCACIALHVYAKKSNRLQYGGHIEGLRHATLHDGGGGAPVTTIISSFGPPIFKIINQMVCMGVCVFLIG